MLAPSTAAGRDAAPNAEALAYDFNHIEPQLTYPRRAVIVKRLFDLAVALFLLVLLSPFFAIAALAIKLSSAGPVFFRQRREGMGGRLFSILKFRSMRTGNPAGLKEQQVAQATQGLLVKMPRDPRVTAVGRWLRATSIDELPQLWNVVRGDMSLVGPRPLIPFMLDAHPEYRRLRARVRPGITGLWQVRDRSNNTSAAAMLPHDLEYLSRFGLKQDLSILLRTIPAVLSGRGAF